MGLGESGKQTALGAPNRIPPSTQVEVTKKRKLGSSQECMVGGKETGQKLKQDKFRVDIKTTFSPWGQSSNTAGYTGMLCSPCSCQVLFRTALDRE